MNDESAEVVPGEKAGDRRRLVFRIVLAGWLVGIALVTLSPVPGRGQSLNLRPGHDLTYHWAMLNVVVNAVLYAPFGAVAAGARVGLGAWWRVVGAAVALATTIEVVQYYAGIGRAADVNDVLADALGAVAAYGVVAARRRRTRVAPAG